MDATEAQSMGGVVSLIAAAIRRMSAAEKVYLVALGEANPHFHLMLVPRVSSASKVKRGLKLIEAHLSPGHVRVDDQLPVDPLRACLERLVIARDEAEPEKLTEVEPAITNRPKFSAGKGDN